MLLFVQIVFSIKTKISLIIAKNVNSLINLAKIKYSRTRFGSYQNLKTVIFIKIFKSMFWNSKTWILYFYNMLPILIIK